MAHLELSYTEACDTVYALGRQQASDEYTAFMSVKLGLTGKCRIETSKEEIANKIIGAFFGQAIDNEWATRDANSLRNHFNFGYRHQIERMTEK